ncbi:MAG: squalene/phytoene synthase family protein [Bacteroidales bacterium]|nr:squalene/phytoene synthase family protein [Bacteroidales bacterium]MCB9014115.1 squalene/phytoene synthase family protein [Bacteroidales bacterium]
MKIIYDNVSYKVSKLFTEAYSTSFGLGISRLGEELRMPVYAIYGFVRLADEIVDSFHDYNKEELFKRFCLEVDRALEEKISLNPILNSFQEVVHKYHIEKELIDTFLRSMEMDLTEKQYDRESFNTYVLGSAEVVGLMCLRVFVNGDEKSYQELKPLGMSLGAAYQKINFLRDIKADFEGMGREYFPCFKLENFDDKEKGYIEKEIERDFKTGLQGIRKLPASSAFGVYLSYVYYYSLFERIRKTPASVLITKRIRIPDFVKYLLMLKANFMYKFKMI